MIHLSKKYEGKLLLHLQYVTSNEFDFFDAINYYAYIFFSSPRMYYDLKYTRKIFVAKYSMCAQNNIYLSRPLAGFNVRSLFLL